LIDNPSHGWTTSKREVFREFDLLNDPGLMASAIFEETMSRHTKSTNPSNTPGRRLAAAAETSPTRTAIPPSHEQIAARAYEIFIARGGQDGRDQDDWYQAESELRLGEQ